MCLGTAYFGCQTEPGLERGNAFTKTVVGTSFQRNISNSRFLATEHEG